MKSHNLHSRVETQKFHFSCRNLCTPVTESLFSLFSHLSRSQKYLTLYERGNSLLCECANSFNTDAITHTIHWKCSEHDWITTWKTWEEREDRIRLGQLRPFQTSTTRGSTIFLRTCWCWTKSSFPMFGCCRTRPSLPNPSTVLGMTLKNCCRSNQAHVRVETTKEKRKVT